MRDEQEAIAREIKPGATVQEAIEFIEGDVRDLSFDSLSGSAITIDADEVILSAGAIGSVQILHRSGIGPGEWLKQASVEWRLYFNTR